MRSHEHDNNLSTFSYLYNEFCLQTYLSFGLPKRITKELTKIRISSHDLLIERGRYFRPKIPRKERKCDICQLVEDEEYFMFFFNDLRSDHFEKLGILRTYQELKPNSHESISVLNKILNQQNVDNVKLISTFISSVLLLR